MNAVVVLVSVLAFILILGIAEVVSEYLDY